MNALATINKLPAFQPGTEEFERTCTHMAREFHAATEELRQHAEGMRACAERLRQAFHVEKDDDIYIYQPSFDVYFNYAGHRQEEDLERRILPDMKRECWQILIDAMGIKNVMSVKDREKFEQQLKDDKLPDITEENISQILMGLAGQAEDFAAKAAREVFEILRPGGHWMHGQYKTNDKFRVGKKVILTWMVESGYGQKAFRVRYNQDAKLTAIDGVFHLLAGKGIMREHRGPLVNSINDSGAGSGETEFFKWKAYRKGTLHLTFKRLDLVQELNKVATGEYVLGKDMK